MPKQKPQAAEGSEGKSESGRTVRSVQNAKTGTRKETVPKMFRSKNETTKKGKRKMKLTIEIPDPPAGCDPAAVQWSQPPKGAWKLVADIGHPKWRKHDTNTFGDTAWVMPYTPEFLHHLRPGWVTRDIHAGWQWFANKPTWLNQSWHCVGVHRFLPLRETPPISGEAAIWEVKEVPNG
jgi:hypothetical protein